MKLTQEERLMVAAVLAEHRQRYEDQGYEVLRLRYKARRTPEGDLAVQVTTDCEDLVLEASPLAHQPTTGVSLQPVAVN